MKDWSRIAIHNRDYLPEDDFLTRAKIRNSVHYPVESGAVTLCANNKSMKRFLLIIFLTSGFLPLVAQIPHDSTWYDLSLEELMNIPITSASRESESSFKAPLTSYVITSDDIWKSGATSIPDALRLAPGLIVREVASGSYDVSIRGGKDNLPAYAYSYMNTSILAMINGRPLFNYLTGGTNWENFPVDLADVDKIEIVYGPNAPLYGPNAVDGVINVITKSGKGEIGATYGTTSIQVGKSYLFSALVGSKLSEKLEMNISANQSKRRREEVEFYDPATQGFIKDLREHSDAAIAANPFAHYPHPELGSQRTGVNFNVFYKPFQKTKLTFNSSYNENSALTAVSIGSSMSERASSSYTQLVRAEIGNLTLQTSMWSGRQGDIGNLPEYNYDFTTWDYYADYNLVASKKLSFRPAISYQAATIDDRKYTVEIGKSGVFNNKATMHTAAFSLKGDYRPMEKIRIIGAGRFDKFKAPDDLYFSYQGIINYSLNNKNNVRLLVGRSYNGSFVVPTYVDMTLQTDPFLTVFVQGNDDLKLLQNNIIELGYRTQLGSKVALDFSIFQQRYSDFYVQLTTLTKMPIPPPAELTLVTENLDLKAKQTGATLAATFLFNKVSFKPSLTYQQTDLTDFSPYNNAYHPIMYPDRHSQSTSDQQSEFAPNIFGGFSLNVPVNKWNINLSGYYYDTYKLVNINNIDVQTSELRPSPFDDIRGKLILNANVGYNLSQKCRIFLNGRNLLSADAREANASDRIGMNLFAGFNISLD
jgi:iron complex outermembrane receptor protein